MPRDEQEVMEQRRVRVGDSAPAQRDRLEALAEEYARRHRAFKEAEARFKQQWGDTEKWLKETKEEILESMQERNIDKVVAGPYVVKAKGRTSRSIDPLKFIKWLAEKKLLSSLGKRLLSVRMTEASKEFGSSVLEREGLVSVEKNPYYSLDVKEQV